ncbi:protein YgfX [[Erwinia] mediterraneensis]|uniref:protein YgfX n=1 Tax=[Erwinia] mediterraneensis TaxID=2161819 RepID=UPI00102F43E7|nr:protein YgfX [[Erwinia] mediterraneensis]
MSAVRWQCDLKPSLTARWLQGGLQGAVIAALLLSPWASPGAWVKPALLLMVLREAWGKAQQLKARQGELCIESATTWRWCGKRWQLQRPLRGLPWGVRVVLRNTEGQTLRFWLMRDAMTPAAWRALRAFWLSR